MGISKNNVVSIHYVLTDEKNKTLDSSEGGSPLVYLHGAGHIIPGLEEALEGRQTGEKFSVTIPPEKAYGPRNDQMKQRVSRDQFPDPEDLKVGMAFQVDSPTGPVVLNIVEVTPSDVVVDANHPLAGLSLTFAVEIAHIRDSTPEEQAHGHVHGEGGHHH